VDAWADRDAAPGVRDLPEWFRELVRDCRWAWDEEVAADAARRLARQALLLGVAAQVAEDAAAALHRDADPWVVPAVEPDEEVAEARDARVL